MKFLEKSEVVNHGYIWRLLKPPIEITWGLDGKFIRFFRWYFWLSEKPDWVSNIFCWKLHKGTNYLDKNWECHKCKIILS